MPARRSTRRATARRRIWCRAHGRGAARATDVRALREPHARAADRVLGDGALGRRRSTRHRSTRHNPGCPTRRRGRREPGHLHRTARARAHRARVREGLVGLTLGIAQQLPHLEQLAQPQGQLVARAQAQPKGAQRLPARAPVPLDREDERARAPATSLTTSRRSNTAERTRRRTCSGRRLPRARRRTRSSSQVRPIHAKCSGSRSETNG